jgi:hypothetical protein
MKQNPESPKALIIERLEQFILVLMALGKYIRACE